MFINFISIFEESNLILLMFLFFILFISAYLYYFFLYTYFKFLKLNSYGIDFCISLFSNIAIQGYNFPYKYGVMYNFKYLLFPVTFILKHFLIYCHCNFKLFVTYGFCLFCFVFHICLFHSLTSIDWLSHNPMIPKNKAKFYK